MTFIYVILLTLATVAIWWLSGFDPKATGENRRADLIRRIVRCVATLILAGIFFGTNAVALGYTFIPLIFIIPTSLSLLWCGPISELLSQGFHRLIDSDDRREFDPNKSTRDLDMIAILLKNGRKEEALQLCHTLKETGDANILVLETLLALHGIHLESGRKPAPLTEACRLRSEGKFVEAETILNSLLVENPSNADAALMLMRLYAQDLRRSDKAAEVLRTLKTQPHVPSSHIEYARRSIHDWSQKKADPVIAPLPESVDELLANGYLGTAIEVLEGKTKEQPDDFELKLKLAEAHGKYCGNIRGAEKIVRQIESHHSFNSEQIQIAKSKLQEWREAKPQKN